jgi:hypothetical protein
MAKPRIIEIADAIVTQMNLASWSQAFTMVRKYLPNYTPTELETLRVTAMVMQQATGLLNRGKRQTLMAIDVGIQKRVDASDAATLDSLAHLSEEITNYWACDATNKGRRGVTGQATVWVTKATNDPIYSVEDLKNRGLFFGHVTLELIEVLNV